MLNPALTEKQVEGVELCLHLSGEGVEIRQRARVARNHEGVLSKLCLGRIQAGLRTSGHQDPRSPIEEHLRRREPHAARAADNHHLFILVPFHMYSPREVRVVLLILNCLVRQ